MKILKLFATMTLCSSVLLTSQFATAKPATSTSVDELIKLSEIESLFETTLQELNPYFENEAEKIVLSITGSPQLDAQQLLVAQQLAKVLYDSTEQVIKQPAVKIRLKEIMQNIYTEEEVQAYNKFLRTPEGQSINRKSVQAIGQMQVYIESIAAQTFERADFEQKVEKVIAPLLDAN